MAAGLGFKTFTTGEVLTAADTNGYLMQGVLVFADAAARTAVIASPQEGQMSYLKDTNSTEYYSGSAWVAVSGGGTNWSLLNAGGTALTGAQTITVSGISGKDKIAVVVNGASSASISSEISIRFNADTGSNYAYAGNQFIGSTTYSAGGFVGFSNLSVTSFPLGRMGGNAASIVHGTLYLTGGNSTGQKMLQSSGGGTDDGSATGMRNYNVGGFYNSASTISSVSVFSSAGNFDAGTVYIYTSA
jgi:hypothetical protein